METLVILKQFLGDKALFDEIMVRSENSPMMILDLVRHHEQESGEKCSGDAVEWLFDKRSTFDVTDAYEILVNHPDFYPGVVDEIYREVMQ